MTPLRIALLGLGNVGRPTAARLIDAEWRSAVAERGVQPPELVAIGVRDPERPRGIELPETVRRTDDIGALVADPGVDIVVEMLGGVGAARAALQGAIDAGKHVVTANKALLAACGPFLEARARAAGVSLRFEASVAGGVPILGALVRDLAGNRIDAVRGIVNGTTNHILSAMAGDARSYDDVLDEAQARGYAEADPTGDVSGADAAHKLAILIRLAFGFWPDVSTIRRSVPVLQGEPVTGIAGVTAAELRHAEDVGLTLKLVARAERWADGSIAAGVTLAAVPLSSPLGQVPGVTNVVEVLGDPIGCVTFRGPGAGGAATSSAVLADILALARGEGSTWGSLPTAGTAPIVDDLASPRPWFFAARALGIGQLPRSLAAQAIVSTDNALVTRPMNMDELRARLAKAGYEQLTLYPVLEMGGH